MEPAIRNYKTLLNITGAISTMRDPEELCLVIVESVKTALNVKGCSLFLVNRKTDALEVAASFGLSREYLNKGPLSALRSISDSFREGPVAIYDVNDDPRIQYPEAAKKEGIASIMAVPIVLHGRALGALRVYTATPWEFTMEDVEFIQAVAQMAGMAIDMCRMNKGLKNSIEILKTMKDPLKVAAIKQQQQAVSPSQGIA